MSKSKPYEIGGSKYAFDFVNGKMVGIQKADDDGDFGFSLENEYLNPKLSNFGDIALSDEATEAYNIDKYGSNIDAYVDTAVQATASELQDYHTKQNKKISNQEVIDNNPSGVYGQNMPSNPAYRGAGNNKNYKPYEYTRDKGVVLGYPYDINPDQDHLKISQWEYVRKNINQSKASSGPSQTTNIAGDGVKGSEPKGSVLLPMPKVVDVNGADWGENKLSAFGLFALGASEKLGNLVNATPGLNVDDKTRKAELKKALEDQGFNTDQTPEEFREALGGLSSVAVTSGLAGLAGNALGTDITPDSFLARTGGSVLNPNAEMLFQGPVIRDFNFTFKMIARSEKEGEEIRRIIKFLKKGMAPKFRNIVFLKAPNIFTLEYRNAGGLLDTVNKFNPGGLALTTINVDYAPSGYWSAYRDSQPVAVKMDLNFTELRPIYQQDQKNDEVFSGFDSVGY